MKANELRIGNLLLGSIYFDEEEARQDLGQDYSEQEEWKITEVEGIPHQFENCTAWTDEEYNRLKPIPLTEEWLVRFGFEKNEDGELETESKPVMKWVEGNDNDWYILFQTYYGGEWNSAYYVKHVHQLQNLYFALTGEELELK